MSTLSAPPRETARRRRPAAEAPQRRRSQVPARRAGWWRRMRGSARPALLALLVAGAIGAVAVAWTSGWAEARYTAAVDGLVDTTAALGLRVEEVMVAGWQQTSRDDLERAVGVVRGDPILTFDPEAARLRLLEIPWVATARVERRLPDAIHVQLTERRPLALWQLDHRLHLIAEDGVVLATDNLGQWSALPLVVGQDAPRYAGELLRHLRAVPTIGGRVAASIRVGGRRWDLQMDNGVRVRLPEAGIRRALTRLADIEEHDRVIDRDILAIDLRLDDRMVIQATPNAIERRHLPEEDT
ncbi:MAG: FtsQ-type POTRA domain-containing protein [Rhodospirillaceae bacterium]|nr:FtsQ-type POTRA domain-containing protein [Rhodospirillaceae bacterium]